MKESIRLLVWSVIMLAFAATPSRGQSVNDALDDPIDCSTGEETDGLLPGLIDIISIDIRKQNEDLVATVEFRGDPTIGDSVSGGIVAVDPNGLDPGSGSDWHFDNAGNVKFAYAGDALSTGATKFVADTSGTWVVDTTTTFTATRAGNVVIIRIPGSELGPGSLWMAYSSSILFEVVPRCDVSGNDNHGFPILEVPTLVASVDAYQAIGNVRIAVPETVGLLVNDIDATSITHFDETSNGGGTVEVDSGGGFVFSPAPGFKGQDVFTYTVTDGKGGVSSANVVVDIDQALWFVDTATQTEPGSGSMSDPFSDLISLSSVVGTPAGPKPADAILVFEGTYQSELILDSAQVLIGQGSDMMQVLQNEGFQIPLYSALLDEPLSMGGSPVIISDSLDAVRLGQHNRLYGVVFADTPKGAAIRGDSVATLIIRDVAVRGSGAILDVAGGQIDITLTSASSDSALVDAISLRDVEGSLVVQEPVVITNPGRHGVSTVGGSATVDFGDLEVVGADSGNGVRIEDVGGQSDLGSVEIRSESGAGIKAAGGGLRVSGGTIQTGDAALDLRSVELDVRLDSLSSLGPRGLLIENASGSLVVDGRTLLESTGVPALDAAGSSVVLAFDNLIIKRADSSFAVRVVQSPGTVLRVRELTVLNQSGGGLLVEQVDSVRIATGSIFTTGGSAIHLNGLTADVVIDSVSVDSADAGIRLVNLGGLVRVGRDESMGGIGTVRRVSGRAVEIVNISSVRIAGLDISDIGGSAFDLSNFGDIRIANMEIEDVDSAAIRASAGGRLEVISNSISNVGAGIEIHEVDRVVITGNAVNETASTALTVSNTSPGQMSGISGKSADGDVTAVILGNEVLTSADEGVLVSAGELGSFLLDLRDNNVQSSTNDYVLSATDSAGLMLSGYAGGDSEAAAAYVRRTNVGSPRVHVVGSIGAGPTGEADAVAVEKTVSDPEPLPERLIEYSVVVTNRGPSPAIGVVVTDSLPDALAYVPATLSINGELQTDEEDGDKGSVVQSDVEIVIVELGDLSVTDTAVVTFSARPRPADAGSLVTNSVIVTSVSPDSDVSNNRTSVEVTIKLNVGVESGDVPGVFALRQNYPNPFNSATTIAFDLPTREFVRIAVLNILGQQVVELIGKDLDAGRHSVRWDVSTADNALTSGLYFYRIEAGAFRAMRPMIVVR